VRSIAIAVFLSLKAAKACPAPAVNTTAQDHFSNQVGDVGWFATLSIETNMRKAEY
jgi:hypothetical protein